MLHRVLKARLQVGPEAFQDTPPNRRGDPKVGACDGRSRESGHGLPKQPQGVTGVLRGLSTPGGSGVLVTSRNWPVTGARAVSKRTRGSDASPSGAAHPPRFVGMVSTG